MSLNISDYKNKLPHLITSIRILLAPIFFFSVLNFSQLDSIFIFILTIVTDGLDGYTARKLNTTTSQGAYFDVVADFIWILAAFSAFSIVGLYPNWLIILFIFMFVQFIATSKSKVPIYDPVGKYYGSFLFLTVFISLISRSNWINTLLTVTIIIFSAASLGSRLYFLLKHEANGNNLKEL
jgi:CDP-diacylglycerol--glycerol-3-phosphate 3-phosphatidyltransferase/cardiolipin synthase